MSEVEELIQAISIGWTPDDFYNSTQFWFHIHLMAEQEKLKRNNVVNLHMLNSFIAYATQGKTDGINYDDIFGIEQLKDHNLLSRQAFPTREAFDEYIKTVVIPLKEELGVL